MIHRKIGKLLLGKATGFQLGAACVLGMMLGFVPGLRQAPGLLLALIALLLVLNANLFLAALTTLLGKGLSLGLLPVSFAIGRWLLDGPIQGLFKALVNAPVLAFFGFEYYVVTGGELLALVLGALLALGLVSLVRRLRGAFLGMDERSERFRAWAGKGWVRFLTWLLVGAKPSREVYEKLQRKKFGNPIRPLGAVLAVLLIVVAWGAGELLSGPLLTSYLQSALERANGATVDLAKADVSFSEGRLTVEGLAMADANDLGTDIFHADRLEADISGTDLLRKRLHFDRITVAAASSGSPRKVPGHRIATAPEPQPPPPPAGESETKPLGDYLRDAKRWEERLAQVRRLLEKVSGSGKPPAEAKTPEERRQRQENLDKRLARRIREQGYAHVAAEHLIERAPALWVSELQVEHLAAVQIDGKPLAITGENLSTQPYLLEKAPRLTVRAADDSLLFDVTAGGAAASPGENRIEVAYRGISGDAAGHLLKVSGDPPIRGGTIDLTAHGTWSAAGRVSVDLPFEIALHDTTLSLPGTNRAEKIDHLTLPVGVVGPIDSPRILFRKQALADALVAAGKERLAREVQQQLGKQVEKAQQQLGKELEKRVDEKTKKEVEDKAKGLLKGILGGKKDEKKE